jgi:hypothetical protein
VPAPNSVLEVAIDIGNGALWSKLTTDANWNNDATANPATNTGGQTLHLTCPCYIGWTGDDTSPDSVTLTMSSGTPPAGFSFWDPPSGGSLPGNLMLMGVGH